MDFFMETRALKSSLQSQRETSATTHNRLVDDINNNGDDFSVDCFFDFSNGDLNFKERVLEDEHKEKLSVSGADKSDSLVSGGLHVPLRIDEKMDDESNSNSPPLSINGVGELSVPIDHIADLEWVSKFVDDFVPDSPLFYPVYNQTTENLFEPELQNTLSFPVHVPTKTRTKRFKTTSPVWSLPQSSIVASTLPSKLNYNKPVERKLKKREAVQADVLTWVNKYKRCSHCQVQQTPQWRTGPMGPKSLCNACGVRFKSGRLFPEYRPACSPTFFSGIHSSSHRKVLEMRKMKETEEPDSSEV